MIALLSVIPGEIDFKNLLATPTLEGRKIGDLYLFSTHLPFELHSLWRTLCDDDAKLLTLEDPLDLGVSRFFPETSSLRNFLCCSFLGGRRRKTDEAADDFQGAAVGCQKSRFFT